MLLLLLQSAGVSATVPVDGWRSTTVYGATDVTGGAIVDVGGWRSTTQYGAVTIQADVPTSPGINPGEWGGSAYSGVPSDRRDRFSRYLQEALDEPDEKYPAKKKRTTQRATPKPLRGAEVVEQKDLGATQPPPAKRIGRIEEPAPESVKTTEPSWLDRAPQRRPPVVVAAGVPVAGHRSMARVGPVSIVAGAGVLVAPRVTASGYGDVAVTTVHNPTDDELIALHLAYFHQEAA